jgi:uncharacterized protein (TIGR03000 family)
MNRQNWKHWLIGGLAMMLLLCAAPRADAHCRGCGSGGYSGGWGGYYSGWWPGNGWDGYYGGWDRYRCYNCGWSSYYPPYYNGYGCNCFAGWAYDTPVATARPVVATSSPSPASTPPASADPGSGSKTTVASTDSSGTLTISVPSDAKVTINDRETRSTGSQRQYVSYGLTPGLVYTYVVRAQVVRNGQVQEDTKTVTLTAGQVNSVAFGFDVSPQQVVANP